MSLALPLGRFTPRLEGLEAREVPAVHAFALDHTLYIFGDSAANVIQVQDAGNGHVTSSIDGKTVAADQIHHVDIFGGGSHDKVDYQLTGPLTVRESVDVFLGRGADSAKFDFSAGIAATGHLQLEVHGGLGKDSESVKMGTIAHGGSAHVDLNGGPGHNALAFRAHGLVNGNLFVNLHTNRHDTDTVVTNVEVGRHGHVDVK